MPTYTRAQLRDGVNADNNLTAATYGFQLENNSATLYYFSIEGKNGTKVFNSASIANADCDFVTGSVNSSFIVRSGSTATFDLVVTKTIDANDIEFRAPNGLYYSLGDNTASGSIFGIEASY